MFDSKFDVLSLKCLVVLKALLTLGKYFMGSIMFLIVVFGCWVKVVK